MGPFFAVGVAGHGPVQASYAARNGTPNEQARQFDFDVDHIRRPELCYRASDVFSLKETHNQKETDMSDGERGSSSEVNVWLAPGVGNVKLVYLLYLVSFVLGITAIIGVVFAYVNRGQSDEWVETHYTYLIRTFWIGLLYFAIGGVLAVLIIGIFVLITVAVWVIVRCVIGLQKAARNEPIADPKSWWI